MPKKPHVVKKKLQKKKVEPKPTSVKSNLYINYRENEHTSHDDLNHDGPYSGSRESSIDLDVHSLHRNKDNVGGYSSYKSEIAVSKSLLQADRGYLVVVRYRTGGTFSTTNGAFTFIAVFDDEKDALALKKEILEHNKKYNDKRGCSDAKYTLVPVTKNAAYKELYCTWHGYFEHLEEVEIHSLEIRE
jgi:hypothetical protein